MLMILPLLGIPISVLMFDNHHCQLHMSHVFVGGIDSALSLVLTGVAIGFGFIYSTDFLYCLPGSYSRFSVIDCGMMRSQMWV
jgi:hypothetical protein